ncbi:hypothetical protein M3J09_011974 [Ascochyta lentis]
MIHRANCQNTLARFRDSGRDAWR